MKILFVEDNHHKRSKISDFLIAAVPDVEIDEAHSFTSGCQKLESAFYDLALLDMTLPTYDRSSTESGGRVRIFGGREIARKIYRNKLHTKVAFVTQLSSFSDNTISFTFEGLKSHLESSFGDSYAGMVYYNSAVSTWRDELIKIIGDVAK
jgi:CheY-like chemotaxis protein